MSDQLGSLSRTHMCGALREGDVDADVVLLGWAHRVRDLGSLVFIDVRDRSGIAQVVVRDDEALLEAAKRVRSEFVIAVIGGVRRRSAETINPKLPTGAVEVHARELRVLSEARTPPFPIDGDSAVSEDVRLRYRYLDLRQARMQANLGLRHRVMLAVRRFLDTQGFWEIETPILTRSTPEGARDYLVPSRVHRGEFYALPQSPQIFKQILMIAGMDRYFQIVKCFRDEDLRADRQPEFTQIDMEMSFAHPELVFGVVEPLIREIFRQIDREIEIPFRRLAYSDALARYGSEKPDLRCGMPIEDVSTVFADSSFTMFSDVVKSGGAVRGFVIPRAAASSRREIDELAEQARQLGAPALVWARRAADGTLQSSALKAAGQTTIRAALEAAHAGAHDLLVLAAAPPLAVSKILGQLRLAVARKRDLLPPDAFEFLWVVDFPLLEWNEEESRWFSMHHPFTSPADDDVSLLLTDPEKVRAKAYDLVVNGSEIAGGSIRIHDTALQRLIFTRVLSIGEEEARSRFGFFLDALEYGTPPHGGIAFGLDRIMAILAGEPSIREVMAFPKTAQAVDLMAGAPSPVDAKQLQELGLKPQA
jgi:aspartyl-tRNA synthetase